MLVVVSLQGGCAAFTPRAPATDYQDTVGRVAVVAGPRPPEIGLAGFVRGKGEGAARGSAETALACLGGVLRGGCTGAFCGAALLLGLSVCGVAGVVGGVVGAAQAPAADTVRAAEAHMAAAAARETAQESLRARVESVLAGRGAAVLTLAPERTAAATQMRDYRSLAAEGVDTVLEASLIGVHLRGEGIEHPLLLSIDASVRLVRTADNREVLTTDYGYLGPREALAVWSEHEGRGLGEALEGGYRALAAHVHDSVFLLHPLPDRQPSSTGFPVGSLGLAPIAPHTPGPLALDADPADTRAWTAVDSLRPTLAWQRFPRDGDRQAAPEAMARVRDVRYDLVIAREHGLSPRSIVYRAEGLPQPVHRLEAPLDPGARYFWTVRARFTLDGRERVSEWGFVGPASGARLAAPSYLSYRFRTRAAARDPGDAGRAQPATD